MKNVKRGFLRLAYIGILMVWFFVRPIRVGVAVFVVTKDKKILLVKHSYRKGLCTPGGFIKKHELFEDAARRELREELRLEVKSLEILAIEQTFKVYKSQVTVVLLAKVAEPSEVTVDEYEVVSAEWYALDNLPKNLSNETKKSLSNWIEKDMPLL